MSTPENHADQPVSATQASERAIRRESLSQVPAAAPPTKRNVMDTLLGEHKLTAHESSSGNDPYNATGRHARR